VQISFAQERTYSGVVSDESGSLPGVSVYVEGSTGGTETDFDGMYQISGEPGDKVEFSFVGMKKVTVVLGDQMSVNVSMTSENLLTEVIVVGYGNSTKAAFTGSAKEIKAEQLDSKNVTNVSQALQGEVAGVQVINNSGQPGSVSTVRIRGFGSVNGNRDPLYVVDGVPFFGSLNSINPNDIASTTVLKDASATAIYGSRGSNGVILITTKSGKSGESTIEVDVKTGMNYSLLPRHEVLRSAEEYIELSWEGVKNYGAASGSSDPAAFANANLFGGAGSSISSNYNLWNAADDQLIDPNTGKVAAGVTRKYDPENWADYGFQNSIRNEANLSMRGGNDKTRYSSSFGYLNDVGYIINSEFTRYSARLNVDSEVKSWFSTTANMAYTYAENLSNGQSSDSGSIFWFADNLPSIYPLFTRDADGNKLPISRQGYGDYEYDYGVGRGFGALTNSIADATYNRRGYKRHELNSNFSGKITFTEGLTFTTRVGAQYQQNNFSSVRNKFYGSAAGQTGAINKTNTESFSLNVQNLLRYSFTLNEVHNFNILAAQESNSTDIRELFAGATRMVDDNVELDELSNFVTKIPSQTGSTLFENSLISYFGQVNYNYDNKYYLSGSLRRDGSSRFVNDKWGTFGSVGATWIMSKENFMSNVDFVDFLKLQASWGVTGDQAGVGRYPGYNGFDIANNNGLALILRPNANPDLTWETADQFSTSIDATLGNFVDVNLQYYSKTTNNLIFERRDAISTGNAISQVNDGVLSNKGFEFDLNFHLVKKENFNLDFGINGTTLNNKITEMPFDPATDSNKVIDIAGLYGRSEGNSLFDFYMREWAGVDPSDGRAMWYQYFDDKNANGILDGGDSSISNMEEYLFNNPDASVEQQTTKAYSNATQKYVGKSAIADVQGAFRLSGNWGNFDFGTLFVYSLGGYSYDGAYANFMDNDAVGANNWHVDIRDRWQQPGDVTNVPRLSGGYDTNVASASTRFLTAKNYLGLNNARIGYSIPAKLADKIGVEGININVSGDNLFFLSERKGFNPSASETGGTSIYAYSPLSTFTFGLKVKF
jgi:TonB-linked SusC/RagA family outer membrane protein